MPDETYQGWTNRETWCANLLLGNDRDTYDLMIDMMADPETDEIGVRSLIEAVLEAENGNKELEGFLADFVNHALARVNYAEIIESWRRKP